MSSAPENAADSLVRDVPVSLGRIVRQSAFGSLRFLSFWAAIFLPLAYLPLIHGGLSEGETTIFTALAVTNLLVLVVGHDYQA